MFKNYLTTALRNLRKHRGFAFINITGLALGMACCILLLLYVQDETGYDRHHAHADRIYRYVSGAWAPTQPIIAPTLADDYPNFIEYGVRFYLVQRPLPVRYGDQRFLEPLVSFADSSVFKVFSYPMIQGDPESALTRPHTIVLTATMAKKYFGDEDPIGKSLDLFEEATAFEVTGVIEDLPSTSYYRFDFLISFSTLEVYMGESLVSWQWSNFYNYVLLREGVLRAEVEAELPSFFERHTGMARTGTRLQPLTEIYLDPQAEQEWFPVGNRLYVYLLTSVALFVLLIACVNFMNLTTARASHRAREVGMRKALGAGRGQLVAQFMGEAVLLSLFALGIALVVVELVLPLFNQIAGKSLEIDYLSEPAVATAFVGLALVVGMLSGSYPAFFLSAFQPVRVLKNQGAARASGASLRKVLVVFQFALSTFLFIGAALIYQQLNFMQSEALGFDREHLITVGGGHYEQVREAMKGVAGVKQVSGGNLVPGQTFDVWPFWVEGMAPDSGIGMRSIRVDFGYVETLGMEMVRGRDFTEGIMGDATESFMLNEAAAAHFSETLGWTDPIGQTITFMDFDGQGGFVPGRTGEVVGVVADFNFASLHQEVEPVVLHVVEDPGQVVLRLASGDVAGTLIRIEATWNELFPDEIFSFSFVNEKLDAQYRAEQRLTVVFSVFTGLAFLIAALGLFGLASFAVTQRTKEIGVRKVFGARVSHIVLMLSRDVVVLVALAFLVAAPIAYLSLSRWLEDFAYHIDIGVGVFLTAGGIALLVALLTVSYQAIKAASANPIDSLRYE